MKKIKVLHIIPSFASGGAERVLLGYMKDFAEDQDVELHTLALGLNSGSIFDDEIAKLNLDIRYAGIDAKKKFSSLLRMKAIYQRVKELKPDIIHSHLRLLPYVTLATLFERNLKRIHTIHTVPQIASSGKMRKVDQFCFQRMNVLPICLNQELAEEAKKLYQIPFCEFLYNGIEIERYTGFHEKEALRNELGIPKDAYVVGHVGRFVPIKNHDFLIDVFYEIKKKKPNSYLLLVGEGPKMTSIQEKCKKLKLEDSVIFGGTRTNVNEILQIMDGYIFPSKKEGLGISLIEAQAAGLRCITSNTVPQETYVSPRLIVLSLEASPKQWCDALLENTESDKKRNQIENFSIQAVNEKLKKLYIAIYKKGCNLCKIYLSHEAKSQ